MPIGQKLLNLREYHRPDAGEGLARVLTLLARPDIRTALLGGGDTLLSSGDLSIEAVVDLQGLGLDGLAVDPNAGALQAGAMVTRTALAQLAGEHANRPPGIIARGAGRWGGSVQRNRATLGGALATAAANDPLIVALLVCDTTVMVVDRGGALALPIAEFLAARAEILARPAVITGIITPLRSAEQAGYALVDVARTPSDAPIVVAGAALTRADGRCTRARLALGGVADQPLRLPGVEAMLEGRALTADLIAAAAGRAAAGVQPAGDFRGSGEYRKAMAGVLAGRALRQAWDAA